MDDREADFWSIEGNYICRHQVEPRFQLYVPKEETFPIPLRYIDEVRRTHATLDVLQESRTPDYWNIDANRNLSVPWTGFTQFTILIEKPLDGYVVRGAAYKNSSRPQGLTTCGPKFGLVCQKQLNERKSSNGRSTNRSSTVR